MKHIDPIAELGRSLNSVMNPVRYLGGEYGSIVKDSADLTFALAFPDLYEIAMSNLAIKILYDGLNRIPSVRCERVFAPAPDFEELLGRKGVPLYTLESGIPLNDADVLGVSIGYEPGITGLLSILSSGGIPLESGERGEGDPIVLAGGCGVTNPAPFARFIDVFFIGEAEGGMFGLVSELAAMKKAGASREDLLSAMEKHPACWTRRKNEARRNGATCARRAIYTGFGASSDRAVCFPTPNMRIVQDHGSVEIMRGCPNGCRFCHAGLYYRPQRIKSPERILEDVEYLVSRGGYREISLMSLSSGDYPGIDRLIDSLTARYAGRNVSFQLPSLKVNSFTLSLLERLAVVRKSGLTFAVETPVDGWQRSLNKEVYRERIVSILNEAGRRGWSGAKFYFMIGLPLGVGAKREADEIVDFLLEIQQQTRMQCTANIGTFIPKPHTPYQWAPQLGIDEAESVISGIKGSLPKGRFKVSAHLPFTAFLESMISRGDERVGAVLLEAWKRGCRLDAWDDWARPDIWKAVISEASWDVPCQTYRARSVDEDLPWDGVSLGPSKVFLRREKERSEAQLLTGRCLPECAEPCGVCGSAVSVSEGAVPDSNDGDAESAVPASPGESVRRGGAGEAVSPNRQELASETNYRVIVSFSKDREIAFVPHLALMEIWNKALVRSGLPIVFTEGFNPLPRFEIAQSLSLGIFSNEEIGSFMLSSEVSHETVLDAINKSLPEHCRIRKVLVYRLSLKVKREALSKFLWGGDYSYRFADRNLAESTFADPRIVSFAAEPGVTITPSGDSWNVRVPFDHDRPLRDLLADVTGLPVNEAVTITKLSTLAANPAGDKEKPVSFFEAFREVRKKNSI